MERQTKNKPVRSLISVKAGGKKESENGTLYFLVILCIHQQGAPDPFLTTATIFFNKGISWVLMRDL